MLDVVVMGYPTLRCLPLQNGSMSKIPHQHFTVPVINKPQICGTTINPSKNNATEL